MIHPEYPLRTVTRDFSRFNSWCLKKRRTMLGRSSTNLAASESLRKPDRLGGLRTTRIAARHATVDFYRRHEVTGHAHC